MSAYMDATRMHGEAIAGLEHALVTFGSLRTAILCHDPKTLNNKVIADYNQNLYAMILTMESYVDMFRITLDEQLNCENPPITRPLLNLKLRTSNSYASNDNVEEAFPITTNLIAQFSKLKRDSKIEESEKCDDSDQENSDDTPLEMDSEQPVNGSLAVAAATTAKFPVKINSEFLVCQAGHNMEYAKHLEVYEIIAFALLVVKSCKSKMHKARQVAYQNDFNLAIKTGKEIKDANAVRVEQHLFIQLLEQYFIADRQRMMSAKGINLFFSMTAKAAGHNLPYQKVKKLMEAIGLKNCYLEGKLYYPNISLKLRDPHVKIA